MAFWKYFWKQSFKGQKNTVNKHAIDIIGSYLKKLMRSGNAISSHTGLISFEIVYETRSDWFGRFPESLI